MSGNVDEAKLLLITIADSIDKTFDSDLISFVGILSIPYHFFVLRDIEFEFNSLQVTCLAKDKVF